MFSPSRWPPVLDCALDQMRLNAIHVYGVEHMSTKDIFSFFDLFGPDTLEWVDDFSCEFIFSDLAYNSLKSPVEAHHCSKFFRFLYDLSCTVTFSVLGSNKKGILNGGIQSFNF